MSSSPTTQPDNRRRNILRISESAVGVRFREPLGTALQLEKTARHFRREESRSEVVDKDMAVLEQHCEITTKMQNGGLGSGVAWCRMLAEGAYADASDGAGDEDAGGICGRRFLREQGSESIYVLEWVIKYMAVCLRKVFKTHF